MVNLMKFLKITLILSFICMASISAALITPALPMMGRYFHISQNATGAIVSVFGWLCDWATILWATCQ